MKNYAIKNIYIKMAENKNVKIESTGNESTVYKPLYKIYAIKNRKYIQYQSTTQVIINHNWKMEKENDNMLKSSLS